MNAPVIPQISFVPGTFLSFRVVAKVHLGDLSKDVHEGEVVQFDGQTMILGGEKFGYSKLRAGINAGWLVPVEDRTSEYKPRPAEVKVRPAQDSKASSRAVFATVSSDEVQVGSARKEARIEEPPGHRSFRNMKVVQEDSGREIREARNVSELVTDASGNESPRLVSKVSARKETHVSSEETLNEGAKSVGRVRIPAKQKAVVTDASKAAQEISALDNRERKVVKSKKAEDPVEVLTSEKGVHAAGADEVESLLGVLEPEDRSTFVEEVALKRKKAAVAAAAKVTAEIESSKSETAKPEEPKAPAPKATIKKPTTIEQMVVEGDELNLGGDLTWDKTLHWLVRVKKVCDLYGDNPEKFEKILSIESEAVAKHARINLGFRKKKAS